jgi:hypothetical protein
MFQKTKKPSNLLGTFQSPSKLTQIGIFGLKTNHLATPDVTRASLDDSMFGKPGPTSSKVSK